MVSCGTAAGTGCLDFHEGAGYNENGERQFIDGFLRAGVKLDHWWIDAGWFEGGDSSWWDSVGNWEPDRERFPHGLKAVSDHAHAQGLKMIVWFEPERVAAGTWLAKNHPHQATYEVIYLDAPDDRRQMAGLALLEEGLPVTLSHRPSSAVVLYRQVAEPPEQSASPSR